MLLVFVPEHMFVEWFIEGILFIVIFDFNPVQGTFHFSKFGLCSLHLKFLLFQKLPDKLRGDIVEYACTDLIAQHQNPDGRIVHDGQQIEKQGIFRFTV